MRLQRRCNTAKMWTTSSPSHSPHVHFHRRSVESISRCRISFAVLISFVYHWARFAWTNFIVILFKSHSSIKRVKFNNLQRKVYVLFSDTNWIKYFVTNVFQRVFRLWGHQFPDTLWTTKLANDDGRTIYHTNKKVYSHILPLSNNLHSENLS